jgi:hypothetical protein
MSSVADAAQLHAEAGAARLRLGSRAASVIVSVAASRRLQFAIRFFERHRRQPPRRSGFGTRDWPHSLACEPLGVPEPRARWMRWRQNRSAFARLSSLRPWARCGRPTFRHISALYPDADIACPGLTCRSGGRNRHGQVLAVLKLRKHQSIRTDPATQARRNAMAIVRVDLSVIGV